LPVNHKSYYKATVQMSGVRGSFEHTLVSHRNPGDGNTAETGSRALGAPL